MSLSDILVFEHTLPPNSGAGGSRSRTRLLRKLSARVAPTQSKEEAEEHEANSRAPPTRLFASTATETSAESWPAQAETSPGRSRSSSSELMTAPETEISTAAAATMSSQPSSSRCGGKKDNGKKGKKHRPL